MRFSNELSVRLSVAAVGALALGACGASMGGGAVPAASESSFTAESATSAGSTMSIETPPPDVSTTFISAVSDPSTTTMVFTPTTLVPGVIETSTTTTLAVGPQDPTGDSLPGQPLHLVVTIDQIESVTPSDPWYDPSTKGAAFHVGVGAIVRFVLVPSVDWRTWAALNIETPHTSDTAVLQPIVDRGDCTGDAVCATFAAIAPRDGIRLGRRAVRMWHRGMRGGRVSDGEDHRR